MSENTKKRKHEGRFNGRLISLLFVCLLISIFFIPSIKGYAKSKELTKWKSKHYKKYNYQKFSQLRIVNQQIDFNNVNYPFLNAAIFFQTNLVREQFNLPKFKYLRALEKMASMHSKDMVEKNFYSHTSPIKSKKTLIKRSYFFKLSKRLLTENINIVFGIDLKGGDKLYPQDHGRYFSREKTGPPIPRRTYLEIARVLLDKWMNSPMHRANILRTDVKYLGCGAYLYYDKSFHNVPKFKATQNFASEQLHQSNTVQFNFEK